MTEETEIMLASAQADLNKQTSDSISRAAITFSRVANRYQMEGKYNEAIDTFIECAKCYNLLSYSDKTANNYLSAVNLILKSDEIDKLRAIKYLEIVTYKYLDQNKFDIAKKHLQDIATLYEELTDFQNAINAYNKLLRIDVDSNKQDFIIYFNERVGDLYVLIKDYNNAVIAYKRAIPTLPESVLDSTIRLLIKTRLCYLCENKLDISGNITISKSKYGFKWLDTNEIMNKINRAYESRNINKIIKYIKKYLKEDTYENDITIFKLIEKITENLKK